jgi:DNA-directed RNA polymerase specialized sigma24 family protein
LESAIRAAWKARRTLETVADQGKGAPVLDADTLVRQAKEGDRGAWTTLYSWLRPRMVRAAEAFDAIDGEAVAQDIFVHCFAHGFPGYRGGGLVAFMLRAVRNRCIDEVRRKRRQDLPLEDLPECASEGASFEEAVLAQDTVAWAFNHAHMSAGDRLLLVLAAEGWTHGDIAGAHGFSAGQVAIRLHRARRRLCQVREERTAA